MLGYLSADIICSEKRTVSEDVARGKLRAIFVARTVLLALTGTPGSSCLLRELAEHVKYAHNVLLDLFNHSQMQKRERTGTSFFYGLDCKSKHFNCNVTEWKAIQPNLRVISGKLSKWQPCKSCKINSIQTLIILWPVYPIHTNSVF